MELGLKPISAQRGAAADVIARRNRLLAVVVDYHRCVIFGGIACMWHRRPRLAQAWNKGGMQRAWLVDAGGCLLLKLKLGAAGCCRVIRQCFVLSGRLQCEKHGYEPACNLVYKVVFFHFAGGKDRE